MGFFQRYPYTNAHQLNLDWIIKIITLFRGGNTGESLTKKSNRDFDFEWSTGSIGPEGPEGPEGPAGPGVAAGGSAFHYLRKHSSTDYDTDWSNCAYYYSVTDLGLTSGSATIAGAYSAMSAPSILSCPIEEFAADQKPTTGFISPTFYGSIQIIKCSNIRGFIFAYGKTTDHGDWRMYLVDGVHTPSGTWVIANGDSGWITATLSTSFKPYLDAPRFTPKYRKIGNIVEITGIVSPISAISDSSTATTVFTLPTGYLPEIDQCAICQGSGSNKFLLQVAPSSGTVTISRYGTTSFDSIPANAWMPFNIIYFVS